VVTPAALGPYKWAPDLEKNAGLATLATSVAKMSDGQTSDIRSHAYEKPAPGGTAPQLLEVIAGRLPGTSPSRLGRHPHPVVSQRAHRSGRADGRFCGML
jgi:hypothetical protein